MKVKRVGIFAGTFNPVHAGHVAFALQAMQIAKLDQLYFLPERRPRHKQGVEHFAHRVAMLKVAVRPHARMGVLELDDVSFTVRRTLPKLEELFRGKQLVFIFGSDVVEHMPEWPLSHRLLLRSELLVGLRNDQERSEITDLIKPWSQQPQRLHLIESHAPDVSSHSVREALRGRRYTPGLLRSVATYSNRHWLYVSLA